MDASSVEGGTVMAGCILFGPSYLLERHLAEWRHLIERRHIAGAGGSLQVWLGYASTAQGEAVASGPLTLNTPLDKYNFILTEIIENNRVNNSEA